jgi:hypothetical protein
LADYAAGSSSWQCQVTASALVATPNVTTNERAPTLCAPGAQTTRVDEDSFSIELGYFQDPNAANGLSAFLYENRTREAFVYFGADGDNPPRAIGRCRLTSGNIGGDARVDLTATATFPLTRAPDVEFGDANESRIVLGAGSGGSTPGPVPATGATAGIPGTFTPPGSIPPADAAAATTAGIVATPTTAWTEGQYVQGSTAGTAGEMYWSGTAWTAGQAPA